MWTGFINIEFLEDFILEEDCDKFVKIAKVSSQDPVFTIKLANDIIHICLFINI